MLSWIEDDKQQESPVWVSMGLHSLVAIVVGAPLVYKMIRTAKDQFAGSVKSHRRVRWADDDGESSLVSHTLLIPRNTRNSVRQAAQVLLQKSKSVSHKNRMEISISLVDLAEALLREGDTDSAGTILIRAASIQTRAVQETMQTIAKSLEKKAQYYWFSEIRGRSDLAKTYSETARRLTDFPTPQHLSEAWALHRETTESDGDTDSIELQQLTNKLEHCLEKASRESKQLVRTFQLKAQCAAKVKVTA